jgi:hypothetical protein
MQTPVYGVTASQQQVSDNMCLEQQHGCAGTSYTCMRHTTLLLSRLRQLLHSPAEQGRAV